MLTVSKTFMRHFAAPWWLIVKGIIAGLVFGIIVHHKFEIGLTRPVDRPERAGYDRQQQASWSLISCRVTMQCHRMRRWWARQDSNLQQHGYEPWVLTN